MTLAQSRMLAGNVVDMNGDGLPDLFTGRSLYLNTGSEFEKKPWSWPNGNTQDWVRDYRRVGGTGTFVVADLVDGNGDGCPDRFDIDATAGVWRYWRNRLCDPVPHAGYETPPHMGLGTGSAPYLPGARCLLHRADGRWVFVLLDGRVH